jgi:TPR repeat protein
MEAGKLRLHAARDLPASSISPSSATESPVVGPSVAPVVRQYRGREWSGTARDRIAFVAIEQDEGSRPRRLSLLVCTAASAITAAFCAVFLAWAAQRDTSAPSEAARQPLQSLADSELSRAQSSGLTPRAPIQWPTEASPGLAHFLIEPSSPPNTIGQLPAVAQAQVNYDAALNVSEPIAHPSTANDTATRVPSSVAENPVRRASSSPDASAYLLAQASAGNRLDSAALIARGDQFLQYSDVASARLFYKLAASHGSAAGAIAMGSSYDPIFLERNGVRGVRPEPARALAWYRIASELGDAGGKARSDQLLEALRQDAARGDAQARAILGSPIP